MITDQQAIILLKKMYNECIDISNISSYKSGSAIREQKIRRLVAGMETLLICLGVFELGQPLPYIVTKKKFLFREYESKESYYHLIFRKVVEFIYETENNKK